MQNTTDWVEYIPLTAAWRGGRDWLAGWVGGKGGKVREGWMSGEGEELRQGVGVRLELRWDKLGRVEVLANQIFNQPIRAWMWRGLMCGCLCVCEWVGVGVYLLFNVFIGALNYSQTHKQKKVTPHHLPTQAKHT